MADELAGGEGRGDEFHAIDGSVKAAFEQANEVFAGITFAGGGFFVEVAELALVEVGVVAFEFLFGFELCAEVGLAAASARRAVLPGPVFALEEGTFGASPEIHFEATLNFMLGFDTASHRL